MSKDTREMLEAINKLIIEMEGKFAEAQKDRTDENIVADMKKVLKYLYQKQRELKNENK